MQRLTIENDAEGKNFLVTKSDIIPEDVSRFIKFYKSPDDLYSKVKMLKHIAQRIGGCYMRCAVMDAINAVGVEVHCDKKYGTSYWNKLLNFVTNSRGRISSFLAVLPMLKVTDRFTFSAKRYLTCIYMLYKRIAKDQRTKIHQTVRLCRSLGFNRTCKISAVCFATPTNTKGMIHVYGRGTLEARAMEGCDLGNAEFSKFAPMIIFNDVFVPGLENVFLCGEYEYAGEMVRNFGNYHRHLSAEAANEVLETSS